MLGLGPVAACGAWDEDTPEHLDFALPTIRFQASSTDPGWPRQPTDASQIPRFPCAGPLALPMADCCAPPYDCAKHPFVCDGSTSYCALTFDVQLSQAVMADGRAGIDAFAGRALARVDLVAANADLAIAGTGIRSADLYVGPDGLTTPSDPGAVLFSRLPVAQSADLALAVEQSGQDAFASFAQAYDTPFSVLLSVHVVLPSGPLADPSPAAQAASLSLELDIAARGSY